MMQKRTFSLGFLVGGIACAWLCTCAPTSGMVKKSKQELDEEARMQRQFCASSFACWQFGLCTAENGKCVATSAEECQKATIACGLAGQCDLEQGSCVARDVEACRRSQACRDLGRCTLEQGQCVVATNDDCARSNGCALLGLCSAVQGECVAQTQSDCQNAATCKQQGRCDVKFGSCIPSQQTSCVESLACAIDGQCSEQNGQCVVSTNDDCKRSIACRDHGQCIADQGRCIATDDKICATSPYCFSHGECSVQEGRCVATSFMRCQAARVCVEEGRCTPKAGECVAVLDDDCKQVSICLERGQCHAEQGQCVARSVEECQTAPRCKGANTCDFQFGQCVPRVMAVAATPKRKTKRQPIPPKLEDVMLPPTSKPALPDVGTVSGSVIDQEGNPIPVAAVNLVEGPEKKPVTVDASGNFSLQLKPGRYRAEVSAAGFRTAKTRFRVSLKKEVELKISLSPEPVKSTPALVSVTTKEIVIKKQVHFATGTARLLPDSMQLLDEVAQVMKDHLEIELVEIGGHTDNRGNESTNVSLSQKRAESVRDYLMQQGIAPERLLAKGYGSSRPKAPNFTERNRARNRRVELKIVKRN